MKTWCCDLEMEEIKVIKTEVVADFNVPYQVKHTERRQLATGFSDHFVRKLKTIKL